MALVAEDQFQEGRRPLQLDGPPGSRPGQVVVPRRSSVQQVARLVSDRIAQLADRKLASLVLWSHGRPGRLLLTNPPMTRGDLTILRREWRHRIGHIWLIACQVARIGTVADVEGHLTGRALRRGLANADGNMFCSELAQAVYCAVTASTATQWNYNATGIGAPSYRAHHIPDFEGDVFRWLPNGAIGDRRTNPSGPRQDDVDN